MAALFGWSYGSTLFVVGIILFFLLAIVNKWANYFVPYNRWTSWALGIIPYFIVGWYWNLKAGVAFGVIGGLAGGLLGGLFLGGTESE